MTLEQYSKCYQNIITNLNKDKYLVGHLGTLFPKYATFCVKHFEHFYVRNSNLLLCAHIMALLTFLPVVRPFRIFCLVLSVP